MARRNNNQQGQTLLTDAEPQKYEFHYEIRGRRGRTRKISVVIPSKSKIRATEELGRALGHKGTSGHVLNEVYSLGSKVKLVDIEPTNKSVVTPEELCH